MNNRSIRNNPEQEKQKPKVIPTQICPKCGGKIGVLSGGFDAICRNCGFKDPCCE